MSQIKLAFVANDGLAFAQETEIGKQLGFITWTPSKLRIELLTNIKEHDIINLSSTCIKPLTLDSWRKNDGTLAVNAESFFKIYKEPKVKFYSQPNTENTITSLIINNQNIKDGHIDIYVSGEFQKDALYGGASPEEKDIEIIAECGDSKSTINAMIRVRRNANELTKKAKEDYLSALSEINKRDEEGIGLGIYSTDFFQMHIKGSKSIAHGSSVFLPWHRLYLVDLERILQEKNSNVSLHYWKFDEAAPNIFKDDFLGDTLSDKATTPLMTEGFGDNFAKFSDSNPLKNWSIGREKLIRRKTWFINQNEQSGYNKGAGNNFYLKNDHDVYNISIESKENLRENLVVKSEYPFGQPNTDLNNLKSFSGLEINPHGEAHTSINGYLNYVPTAPKDPLFFFLHSNVDRLWSIWQTMVYNGFDKDNEHNYPKFETTDWRQVDKELWPWKRASTPNEYHMIPPGTRAENFTKSFLAKNFNNNVAKISDAIDAFGTKDITNSLGFGYDYVDTYRNNSRNYIVKESIDILNSKLHNIVANQQKIALPNAIHSFNNRLLAKIVSDNDNILNSNYSGKSINLNANKNLKSNMLFLENLTNEESPEIFVDLDNFEQYFTDIKYLNAAHNYDINLLGEVEHQFDILSLKASSRSKISKHLVIYILSIINNEKIQDEKIVEFVHNNIDYLSDISNEENLDVKITLYSFASNSTIKDKIIPIFFPNEKGLDTYLDELKKKTEGSDSMANKYWALHTLLTNAGVGVKK